MPVTLIPSFIFYAFVSGITPGPANLCSLAAAIRYGKKQALRQWTGLFTGYFVIAQISSILLYFVGNAIGEYVKYLKWIGAAYIIYLAIHMLRSSGVSDAEAQSQCNFFTGLFVQLTNVKIMVYTLTTISSYVLPYTTKFLPVWIMGFILPFTGPMCNLVWLYVGDRLRNIYLAHEKLINWIMALSLIGCAISIVAL